MFGPTETAAAPYIGSSCACPCVSVPLEAFSEAIHQSLPNVGWGAIFGSFPKRTLYVVLAASSYRESVHHISTMV